MSKVKKLLLCLLYKINSMYDYYHQINSLFRGENSDEVFEKNNRDIIENNRKIKQQMSNILIVLRLLHYNYKVTYWKSSLQDFLKKLIKYLIFKKNSHEINEYKEKNFVIEEKIEIFYKKINSIINEESENNKIEDDSNQKKFKKNIEIIEKKEILLLINSLEELATNIYNEDYGYNEKEIEKNITNIEKYKETIQKQQNVINRQNNNISQNNKIINILSTFNRFLSQLNTILDEEKVLINLYDSLDKQEKVLSNLYKEKEEKIKLTKESLEELAKLQKNTIRSNILDENTKKIEKQNSILDEQEKDLINLYKEKEEKIKLTTLSLEKLNKYKIEYDTLDKQQKTIEKEKVLYVKNTFLLEKFEEMLKILEENINNREKKLNIINDHSKYIIDINKEEMIQQENIISNLRYEIDSIKSSNQSIGDGLKIGDSFHEIISDQINNLLLYLKVNNTLLNVLKIINNFINDYNEDRKNTLKKIELLNQNSNEDRKNILKKIELINQKLYLCETTISYESSFENGRVEYEINKNTNIQKNINICLELYQEKTNENLDTKKENGPLFLKTIEYHKKIKNNYDIINTLEKMNLYLEHITLNCDYDSNYEEEKKIETLQKEEEEKNNLNNMKKKYSHYEEVKKQKH